MKKEIKTFLIILSIGILINLVLRPIFVFAQETVNSSTNTQTNQNILQKTLKTIEDLVSIKDEENESLAFRIKTFKQVIELAIVEAKELKIKILSLDKLNDKELNWQKEQIEKLNAVIEFYENEQKILSEQELITLEWIKNEAQNFKEWRENNYLPLTEEITNFLLIQQQQKAIETAQERLKKINRDLQLLKKGEFKNTKLLSDLFTKAEITLNESVKLNKKAINVFWENQKENQKKLIITNTTTTSSSTALSPPLFIRDLVKESLNKIKETYQIFIEMSKLVKTSP
jgi:hypothetical protein